MKILNFKFQSLAILLAVMLFTACSKDDPKDVRDDYVGTYSGTNAGTFTPTTGAIQNFNSSTTLIVTKSSTDNTKITFSFASSGTKYDGTVSANNFVIQNQTATFITASGGTGTYTISGNGTRDTNKITYNYVAGFSNGIQRGTVTLTK